MLFAIPSRELSLSNHFAKAPQIVLWDSQSLTERMIELPESSNCCGHKKFWIKTLQDNQVDAVVVRSIGTNMLNTLLKLNVAVLSAPRGFDITNFDQSLLTPVTNLGFARPSPNSKKHGCATHSDSHRLQRPSYNGELKAHKLSPTTMKHLTKAFERATLPEKKR
ncbi:NifB/NifX family molybdenum-iron cluster-binding protein [Vibrio sp. JPW-9-11-11]|uniref:NifB/NifX family molybdenum-iron cluster-binding protein n=1 Tax=Vibrio sp. JPW-9-11-11 TaxID=1416532 RepID=UPI0015939399|nr:NifB/NifX family molybdenum-iron cluster-binding protein [Vibrio sp. JPW-9-11-11]